MTFTTELLNRDDLEANFGATLDNFNGDVLIQGVTILVKRDCLANNRLRSRDLD